MAVCRVCIMVDPKTGEITVDRPLVVIGVCDEIEWVSEDDVHFAVHFPYAKRQPFRSAVFHKGMRTGTAIVASGPTRYKYNVHVRGAILDPDVEIGDPPGGKG